MASSVSDQLTLVLLDLLHTVLAQQDQEWGLTI